MREILFRGKRADNGEWVEGHYFSCWDKNYICWGTINENIKNIEVMRKQGAIAGVVYSIDELKELLNKC